MDKNWVYFGPFRPKIDPKMVSYKITFTKKWFFITTFHLFTQIRIILDHQVWDHFSNKRNLNKRIWMFWAPVLEKKSNRILKNIFFSFWVHWVVFHYHMLPMFLQFKDEAMPDAYWLDIQPKNITVHKQNLKNKRTRHCQKPLSWPPCCILGNTCSTRLKVI